MKPLEKAKRAVTYPGNLIGAEEEGFRIVDVQRVMDELTTMGALDRVTAETAGKEAVEALGGDVTPVNRHGEHGEDWRIPEAAIRHDDASR